MKKIKNLYLIDSRISWRVFKELHDKVVKDSGPTPKDGDKILWKLIRDKRILAGFRPDMPNDMWIGTSLPKYEKLFVIGNPKK